MRIARADAELVAARMAFSIAENAYVDARDEGLPVDRLIARLIAKRDLYRKAKRRAHEAAELARKARERRSG